jgi:hypothetical protein
MFAQQPRAGFVPLSIGTGENSSVIDVSAMMIREQLRRAMNATRR